MTGIAKRRMEPAVFGLALDRLGTTQNGRGNKRYAAARLVMCEGWRMSQAVRVNGVSRQAVYQAMDKIETAYDDLGICAFCGQRLPNV